METEHCDCGCPFFKDRTVIKKISGILIGSLKEEYAMIHCLSCEKCGKPHKSVADNIVSVVRDVIKNIPPKTNATAVNGSGEQNVSKVMEVGQNTPTLKG